MDTVVTLPDVDDVLVWAIAELRSYVSRLRADCGDEIAVEWCRQLADLIAR
jgi:hypothetical protein